MADIKPRITFSPEQQKRVDELIDIAYGKGRHKAGVEAALEINALRTRIAELENKKPFSFWRRK